MTVSVSDAEPDDLVCRRFLIRERSQRRCLQQRYGYAKDQARKEITDWLDRQK